MKFWSLFLAMMVTLTVGTVSCTGKDDSGDTDTSVEADADADADVFCSTYDATCVTTTLSDAYTDCAVDIAAMAPGTAGDTDGNTAACRAYHLSVAVTADANVHCPHAGPDGGGVCVDAADPVADFCASYQTTCVDTTLGTAYTDCATEAAAFDAGTDGDAAGNTLACRVYHLDAAQTDATTHCPHAAADGGGVCQ